MYCKCFSDKFHGHLSRELPKIFTSVFIIDLKFYISVCNIIEFNVSITIRSSFLAS